MTIRSLEIRNNSSSCVVNTSLRAHQQQQFMTANNGYAGSKNWQSTCMRRIKEVSTVAHF